MSELDINYAPVRDEDRTNIFIKDKPVAVAPGCVNCEILSESNLASSLFQNGNVIQMTLIGVDAQPQEEEPRLDKERSIELAIQRGRAGINGSCGFIKMVDDCWRRDPVVDRGSDYEQGVDYANESNNHRNLSILRAQTAAREEEVAARLSAQAEVTHDLDAKGRLIIRADVFAKAAAQSHESSARHASIFEKFSEAAADLLGRPGKDV